MASKDVALRYRGILPVCSISGYPFSVGQYLSTLLFAAVVWVVAINVIRYFLKLLLTYHGWMYEMHGKMSIRTKLWLVGLALQPAGSTGHRHMHARIHTHARIHPHAYAHTHACMHTHTRTCTHAYIHTHACTHAYTRTHARTHTCTHTCIHSYTHTHIHTHARTHTHTHTQVS